MLRKTISYKDWDDRPVTEDLHFHLGRADVLRELALIDRMEEFKKKVIDDAPRELSTPEKQEMVDLIHSFMRLSYGKKDGAQFRKSTQIWQDFEGSAAYENYFWTIFSDMKEFEAFMTGILPADLMEEARKEMSGQERLPFSETPPPLPKPAEKPLDEMTPEELRARLAELEGK